MEGIEEVAGANKKPVEGDLKAAEAQGGGIHKKTTEYSFFIRTLYGKLLETGDTYPIKLRKVLLAVAFFCSFVILLGAPYDSWVHWSRGNASPRAVVNNIAQYAIALATMGCWGYCRYTKRADDTLMDILLGTFVLSTIVFVVSTRGLPYQPLFLAYVVVATTMNTKLKKLHLFLWGVGYVLLALEATLVEKGILPRLQLPGKDYESSLLSLILRQVYSGLSVCACYAIQTGVITEYSLILTKSATDVQLARDVTEKLVANDTEGAVTILDEAKQKPGDVVDAKLVVSLDGLRIALEAFFKYVPRHVVTFLSKAGTLGKIGMSPARATFSFTDIKGFTTLSTRVKPEALANMLTMFFGIQTTIVEAYRGVVDKYIGDCIMVLWGVLEDIGCPNLRACCAALAMDRATRIPELVKAFALGKQPLAIRTGIHGGDSLAGNMGSLTRMNYTVIGDPVNTAARLEPANKDFGTRILASEDVVNALESGMKYIARRLMTNIRVAGRDQAVRVYEIMGIMPEEGGTAAVVERPAAVTVSDAARSEGPSAMSGDKNTTVVKLEERAVHAGRQKNDIEVLELSDDTTPSAGGVGGGSTRLSSCASSCLKCSAAETQR